MEKKGKILIVDDEIDTVELLRKRLRFEGYDTLEAYSGEECLEQASAGCPDLIILDIMMPQMDGFEVCRRLKVNRNTARIPVLMLTAKGGVEDKVKGLEFGAHDYLVKPFDYKELSARVKSLLSMEADRERLAQKEKSEALDHMMDELAHELRNPLTSIGGFARRVYENLSEDDPNKKYLQIIIKEVTRLESMVRDLVELKTSAICYREPAGINDLIVEVIEHLGEVHASRGVHIETHLAENLPLLSIDKEHMKLALENIVENSIEAMQEMPSKIVTITSRMEDDHVEIQITDTGRGIPKDKIKNIFDPFVTSKASGPGLGLTFALKIIQEHKGAISVESEPAKGSNFTIRLPVRKL